MKPDNRKNHHNLKTSLCCMPAEPLYKRVPQLDEHGKPLSYFMMILPRLRSKPQQFVHETIQKIERILEARSGDVVFADLNLKLNVLWVCVKPAPGICRDLPMEINNQVPEALLVAQPAC